MYKNPKQTHGIGWSCKLKRPPTFKPSVFSLRVALQESSVCAYTMSLILRVFRICYSVNQQTFECASLLTKDLT